MNEEYFILLLIAGTILFLILVFFILSYIIIYARRIRSNALEKARILFEHQRSILNARLEEQERAMTQISKEIHDNVSQQIDFIHMNVKALAESSPRADQARFINNAQSLLEQVTNDLRNISYSLNSDYIKARGLSEVIEKELNYIQSARGIHCELHMEGNYRALSGEQELLLYRIAQEALHNVVKYAQASSISTTIRYTNDGFRLEISDNGIGFDPAFSEAMSGLGFKNMRQRAELMDAELRIDASPGGGCTVCLEKK